MGIFHRAGTAYSAKALDVSTIYSFGEGRPMDNRQRTMLC